MKKIFLAIGHIQFEKALERKFGSDTRKVGVTDYREGIVRGVEQYLPDIVIIREGLPGNVPILDVIYELKNKYSKLRIIFMSNDRVQGDKFLACLVNYGVYDILVGTTVNINAVLNLIDNPNELKDVSQFQPKFKLNESDNELLFEAPAQKVEKVEVVKYIDNTSINDKDDALSTISDLDNDIKIEKVSDEEVLEINDLETFSFEKMEDDNSSNIDEEKIKQEILRKSEQEKQRAIKIAEMEKQEALRKAEIEKQEAIKRAKEETQNKINEELRKKELEIKREKKQMMEEVKERDRQLNKLQSQVQNMPVKNVEVNGKQKIISFLGGKHGVGNTQVAFNTAINLALNGYKVLYLEFSNNLSTIGYLYQMNNHKHGIDTALKKMSMNEFDEIDNAIINMGKLKNNVLKSDPLFNSYNKMPDCLDIMLVSDRYIEENHYYLRKEDFDSDLLKELYFYLMYQKSYDYLILDLTGDVNENILNTSILYSTKVLCTISQDVHTISSTIIRVNYMNKNRINLRDKLYYIINRFDSKISLSVEDIKSWLGTNIPCNVITTIDDYNKLFSDSNYMGIPILFNSPGKQLKRAFNDIESVLKM
ncbi:hypothetical protein C4D27_11195 [Clostridium perfringens]